MDTAFVLYENMTALDLVGPYEVLANHPQITPYFVAAGRGHVRCDVGLTLVATATFEDWHGRISSSCPAARTGARP